jgi:hypothetical protein
VNAWKVWGDRSDTAGKAMVDFIETNELICLNSRRRTNSMPEFTYICDKRGHRSFVDYIL